MEDNEYASYRIGEIYWINFNGQGHLERGIRPGIIVQNNIGNIYSPVIQVVPVTSSKTKTQLPTHVKLAANKYGLTQDSVVLCENQGAVNKTQIKAYIGVLDEEKMKEVVTACLINTPYLQFLNQLEISKIIERNNGGRIRKLSNFMN